MKKDLNYTSIMEYKNKTSKSNHLFPYYFPRFTLLLLNTPLE